jgi:hypothetical protein
MTNGCCADILLNRRIIVQVVATLAMATPHMHDNRFLGTILSSCRYKVKHSELRVEVPLFLLLWPALCCLLTSSVKMLSLRSYSSFFLSGH